MTNLGQTSDHSTPGGGPTPRERKLTTAFKLIAVLATVVACQAVIIGWLWISGPRRLHPRGPSRPTSENLVREAYPEVDFTTVYPGESAEDIEEIQQVGFGQRFIYEPYVQFRMEPVSSRFVEVTAAGYRAGPEVQPWPPSREHRNVFVFGGSTTFGYAVRARDTVAHAIQEELARSYPGESIQCYNFARGYYISAQELALFESLLRVGIVPELAVFVDGLNDYVLFDGQPNFTHRIAALFTPEKGSNRRTSPRTESEMAHAVKILLDRYRRNLRIVEGVSEAHGVAPIFVGQPVPFVDFEVDQQSYPFTKTMAGLSLAHWGYSRFESRARAGDFGEHFVWCGDAFVSTDGVMYVDSIHYSGKAARRLAETIVVRSRTRGLIPW